MRGKPRTEDCTIVPVSLKSLEEEKVVLLEKNLRRMVKMRKSELMNRRKDEWEKFLRRDDGMRKKSGNYVGVRGLLR